MFYIHFLQQRPYVPLYLFLLVILDEDEFVEDEIDSDAAAEALEAREERSTGTVAEGVGEEPSRGDGTAKIK